MIGRQRNSYLTNMLTPTRRFLCSGPGLIALVIWAGIILSPPSYGQADTGKMFMNTVRVNVSNPMMFGWKFNVIGYERVITDHQSASISFGRTAFPKFSVSGGDSLGITNQSNDKGLNMSLDYRFYLKNENNYNSSITFLFFNHSGFGFLIFYLSLILS